MKAARRVPLTVDVVSDVVCPWCFIGKRRLEKAAATAGIPLAVRWRPFQLDPTIPREGKDRRDYLLAKFGTAERIRQLHESIAVAGKEEGIAFAFERIAISPNTLDAHRLIRWAAPGDIQERIVEALFRAYFLEGRNIGDREELASLAADHGMDRDSVAARLASDEDRDAVQQEIGEAQRIGTTGVPTFIVDGRYGVVGAQPAEALAEAFRTIAARATGSDGIAAACAG